MFRRSFPLYSALFAVLSLSAVTLLPASLKALTIDEFDGGVRVEVPTTGGLYQNRVYFSSSQAIGGGRTLAINMISGDENLRASIVLSGGEFNHSQDSQVKAQSQIIWDGDNNVSNLNTSGLGGLDLTQDGGQALEVRNLSNDLPASLNIRIYDAQNQGSYLENIIVLDVNLVPKVTPLTVSFDSMIAYNGATLEALRRVGAIVLTIEGSDKLDLSMTSIGTNGKCTSVPSAGRRLVDDCGVCGGNNEAKDSCGVCFGEDAAKDSCGVCFGNNKDLDRCGQCFGNNKLLDDCSVCGGNNKSKDICGVCGGNGTSCLDCAGVANGTSKLDSCGVCGGDNTTCRVCTANDVNSVRKDVNKYINDQHRYILKLAGANSAYASIVAQSKALNDQNRKLVLRLPKINTLCTGAQCSKKTINTKTISAISKNSKTLYNLTLALISSSSAPGEPGGVCHHSINECIARLRQKITDRVTKKAFALKYYRATLRSISKVPKKESVCK